MTRSVSFSVSVGMCLLLGLVAGAAEPGSRIAVAGRQVGAGVYAISVETTLEASAEYDGLLIWAEPSHTLLLAQTGGGEDMRALESGERPLVQVSGPLGATAPNVQLRYEVGGDTRLVVQLVRGGQRLTIADGRVNLAAFRLTSSFSGPVVDPLRMKIRHCVTCDPCGTMCVECIGPKVTANCVECWIECGW